jgi:O-antigen ligase
VSNSATMRSLPASGPRSGLLGFALGCAAGAFLVFLTTSYSLNWVLYIFAALIGVVAFPKVAALFGGPDRLALSLFVFGLILEVDYWVTWQNFGYPGGVNGLGLNLIVLAGMFWVAVWVPARRAGIAAAWEIDRTLRRAVIVFLLVSVASGLGAISSKQWFFGLFLNAAGVFVALLSCHIVSTAKPETLKLIWRVILVALLAEALLVLLQNALGFTFSLKGQVFNRSASLGRYSGTYSVPSATGTFLAIGLFFAMMEMLLRQAGAPRWLTVSAFGTGLIALLLTKTRTAWIGFAGGAAVLGLWALRSGYVRRRTLVAVAALAVLALGLAWPTLASRLSDNHEGDWEVRWNLILLGIQVIKAHPIFGVGVNCCYLVIKDYVPASWHGVWIFVPHNQFLLMGAEAGIPGMLALIYLFFVGLRAAKVAAASSDPFIRHNGLLLRVVLWSLVWALNLDFVLGAQTYYLVFFMIGMAVGLRRLAERTASEPLPA